jgi:hypothetical protein
MAGRAGRLISLYLRIGRTYRAWAPALLLLAVIVFVPLGLLDAVASEVDLESLDVTEGIKVAALVAALGAVTTTSLLGEVFFSGAVAVSLTHSEHDRPPPLREIAGRLRYGRLIAVDIAYVLIVVLGLLAFVVPGVLAFVWFGLAGPVVELEDRTVRGALVRSWRLVRGNFWVTFGVLVPIELVGDAVGEGIAGLVHGALGDSLWASWLAESLSNIVFSPLFAVAAVLLTIELIGAKGDLAPRLHSAPSPA